MASPPRQGNGAIFGGGSGEYRYRLWRTWDDERARLLWVLLNPSKADEQENDPTVGRCIAFSCQSGYGGLEIVNLFAFCATDPRGLKQTSDPVGSNNDRHIVEAATCATDIVVAWGEQGNYRQRDRAVLALLRRHAAQPLRCLGTVSNGSPRHPLRLTSSATFVPYPYPNSTTEE